MNIMFMTKFPDGTPTDFAAKISISLEVSSAAVNIKRPSPKLHTIRASKRIKEGMNLSLRNWIGKPYRSGQKEFASAKCISTQDIKIEWENHGVGNNGKEMIAPVVWIEGEMFYAPFWGEGSKENLNRLAVNDGFNCGDDFLKWFNKDFEGQIIHWTELRY